MKSQDVTIQKAVLSDWMIIWKILLQLKFFKKKLAPYVITTDEGVECELSAILPLESVSADYGSEKFALNLGKRLIVRATKCVATE